MSTEPARIEGLRETRSALRSLDRTLPRRLRPKFNEAAQLIVDRGRANASTPQQRRAAESLRTKSTQSSIAVALGMQRYPFALGAEFGSIRYPQFPAWRGSDAGAGYFMWPAIRSERPRVISLALEGVDQLTREVGLS